jgi:hypothetical protein
MEDYQQPRGQPHSRPGRCIHRDQCFTRDAGGARCYNSCPSWHIRALPFFPLLRAIVIVGRNSVEIKPSEDRRIILEPRHTSYMTPSSSASPWVATPTKTEPSVVAILSSSSQSLDGRWFVLASSSLLSTHTESTPKASYCRNATPPRGHTWPPYGQDPGQLKEVVLVRASTLPGRGRHRWCHLGCHPAQPWVLLPAVRRPPTSCARRPR